MKTIAHPKETKELIHLGGPLHGERHTLENSRKSYKRDYRRESAVWNGEGFFVMVHKNTTLREAHEMILRILGKGAWRKVS